MKAKAKAKKKINRFNKSWNESRTAKIFLRTVCHVGHTCNIPRRDVRIEDAGTKKHCTNTTITTEEHHTEREERKNGKKEVN